VRFWRARRKGFSIRVATSGYRSGHDQALLDALDEGIVAARAGDYVDAADFVQELLVRK
jgi:hypothetical protein